MSNEPHPESFCHRCGGKNIMSWSVDSDRWNLALTAVEAPGGILCPACFVEGHEAATGLVTTWKLVPDRPFTHGTWDEIE